MKKLSYVFALFATSFLVSCGGGDDCDLGSWTGTWTLESTSGGGDCDDPAFGFPATLVIASAPSADGIAVNGELFSPDFESCRGTLDEGPIELNGDEIKLTIDECSAIYK